MNLNEAFIALASLGAGWVLWLLAMLSTLNVGLTLDRAWYFWRRRAGGEEVTKRIFHLLRTKDLASARAAALRYSSTECLVLAAGLSELKSGPDAAEQAMLAVKEVEIARMKGNLDLLSWIANGAFRLGLLGAVLGAVASAKVLLEMPEAERIISDAALRAVLGALAAPALATCVSLWGTTALQIFDRRISATESRIDAMSHLLVAHIHAEEHQAQLAWQAAQQAQLAATQAA